jgi:PadR family transcriptional regulator PadR
VQSFMPRGKSLTPVQVWILLVLSKGPNYGYRIIRRLERMFRGYWKPKAGTIYPALERLSAASLVSSRVEHRDDAPDRRYYTITEKGKESLTEAVMRWSKMLEHVEAYGETHRAIRQFRGSLSTDEMGALLIRMGDGLRHGLFDVSEILPPLEAEIVEPTDPLAVKFLYAWEDGKLEVELEFEWIPPGKERTRGKRVMG